MQTTHNRSQKRRGTSPIYWALLYGELEINWGDEMKAKDLIDMLKTIDPDAQVITPGFDETYAASDFSLVECVIHWNKRRATSHFAPHDFDSGVCIENKKDINGYVLDGKW